jgi:hypothetical protein
VISTPSKVTATPYYANANRGTCQCKSGCRNARKTAVRRNKNKGARLRDPRQSRLIRNFGLNKFRQ